MYEYVSFKFYSIVQANYKTNKKQQQQKSTTLNLELSF